MVVSWAYLAVNVKGPGKGQAAVDDVATYYYLVHACWLIGVVVVVMVVLLVLGLDTGLGVKG